MSEIRSNLNPGGVIDWTPLQDNAMGQTRQKNGTGLEGPVTLMGAEKKAGDQKVDQQPVLPSVSTLDPQNQKNAIDKLGGLSEPSGMADIFMIMAEFYKLSMAMRDSSKQAARSALNAQVSQIKDQANHMREAAKFALAASIVSGVFQIASGALQMAGGFKAMAYKGSEGMSQRNIAASSQAIQLKWSGVAQSVGGAGKVIEGSLNFVGQGHQADSTVAQANATKLSGERDEMLKFKENMQENMRATLQALQQIMQSREQTVQKIFA